MATIASEVPTDASHAKVVNELQEGLGDLAVDESKEVSDSESQFSSVNGETESQISAEEQEAASQQEEEEEAEKEEQVDAPAQEQEDAPAAAAVDATPAPAPAAPPKFKRAQRRGSGTAFTEKLDDAALEFFNEVAQKPFSEQAVQFLNAYWNEVGDQAEFIFSVAWETMQYADMHTKGVNYIHLYDEGNDLDFNIGLYFYEKLCKKVLEDDAGKKWRDDPKFAPSMPSMMTAIKRKQEIREKVDVNFDGRISFLEYLLYQYQDFTNPADFTFRAMKTSEVEEHPEIIKARNALDEVNKAIREYEREKQRLEEESQLSGVKGLKAKHQLSILEASPLAQDLNAALIKAEASVRMASRKFGSGPGRLAGSGGEGTEKAVAKPTQGTIWWMNRDLELKKERYGRKKKA